MAVLGINTARSLTFKDGRISRAQIDAATQRFAHCAKEVMRVVVTHHAFDTPAMGLGTESAHKVVGRADLAMAGFAQARVDLILSGHLHSSGVGETAERYPSAGRSVLLVRAGTATSTRQRGEVNAFNVVRITPSTIAIECMIWRADKGQFLAATTEHFQRVESRWSRPERP
jgi:3',5'-cyclic AMP phosphodiesterase CpdA